MLRERAEFIEQIERDLRTLEAWISTIRHDFLALPKGDYPARATAIRRSRSLLADIREQIPLVKDRIEANYRGAMDEAPFQEEALDRLEVCRYDADIVSGSADRLAALVATMAEGWDIA